MTSAVVQGAAGTRRDPVPTLGVEEEFLLLRPDGDVACVGPEVLRLLSADPAIQPEWMRYQVETATSVCTDLSALADELTRSRRALAAAATACGASLVAAGTPPFDVPSSPPVTENLRYLRLAEQFPAISRRGVASGCHVHVAVPDRDAGVMVLSRIEGWLPVLLGLSTNSPLWRGRDTRWASYRYVVQRAWPTATPAPRCPDAASYDAALAARLAAGDAMDPGSVYWFARLSPRYPTVEIRIADTCLAVEDAVLIGSLCRALVATALPGTASSLFTEVPERLLSASLRSAAQGGLDAIIVDPRGRVLRRGRQVLAELVDLVAPALDAAGDGPLVAELVDRRLRRGSGSERQRALRRRLDREAFVAALAEETVHAV